MSTFVERATELTRSALVGVAMSLAQEVGIFRILASSDCPLTSGQVAEAGKLKERYARELLGCLATARLVEVSKSGDEELQYSLEDGASEALNARLGPFLTFPSLLASIFSPVKDCFYKDGPTSVRYTDQVHDILDSISRASAPGVAETFLAKVPDLKIKLDKGIDVIEFGSGRGRLSATLAQQFPNSRFVASEVVPDLVKTNKDRWAHIANLTFSLDDLCSVPEVPNKQYDWVFCCDVIHDLPNPLAALQGIKRMLRQPNGLFSFLDIATSGSPLKDKGSMHVASFYALGTFLCIPESYQRSDSLALGPCSGKHTIAGLATKAGFQVKDVPVEDMTALFICELPK
ncbi:hypothetical protein EGW08_017458 [Elysia chlorotica]|uniref:Uncharacterized protein n=1 Tax=Elysia chlorotica TaxID=188477 RepID=A0A3S1B2W4_ELYCH|nr:hypothetical protein EGW08_017458 [Elysia chlorotica]